MEDIKIENLERMKKTLAKMLGRTKIYRKKYEIDNIVGIQMYPISHTLYNNIYNEYWKITGIKHIDDKTLYFVNWNWYFEDVIYLINN